MLWSSDTLRRRLQDWCFGAEGIGRYGIFIGAGKPSPGEEAEQRAHDGGGREGFPGAASCPDPRGCHWCG